MFFNKKSKQKKLDPKVRFQNRQFNQKLQQARTFKRTTKPIAEGSVDRFLSRMGLGSRLLQAGLVLLAIGIVYLVYIPNFLSLQSISVEGASDSDRMSIEAVVRDSLGSAPFYNPQRNLFFVSKSRVQEAVLSVAGVGEINQISKNFNNGQLHIVVTSKYEKFLVRTNERVYDVYNDGVLKGEAGVSRAEWDSLENPSMIKINIASTVSPQDTREFLTASTVKYISELQENAQGIVGSTLKYINLSNAELGTSEPPSGEPPSAEPEQTETPSQSSDEISESEISTGILEPTLVDLQIRLPISAGQLDLVFQKGTDARRTFRVIVDTKESAHDLVQRLNLLLSQTSPERYGRISYIDLRVKSRAYVCLLNTVCD